MLSGALDIPHQCWWEMTSVEPSSAAGWWSQDKVMDQFCEDRVVDAIIDICVFSTECRNMSEGWSMFWREYCIVLTNPSADSSGFSTKSITLSTTPFSGVKNCTAKGNILRFPLIEASVWRENGSGFLPLGSFFFYHHLYCLWRQNICDQCLSFCPPTGHLHGNAGVIQCSRVSLSAQSAEL